MRRLAMAMVVTGLLAAPPTAWSGWVIDEGTKGGGDDKGRQRLFMQSNRLKAMSFEGTRTTEAMVMDLDAQTITHIDYKERAYVTATAKEYAEVLKQGMQMMGEGMGREMQAQMKEMEAELKKMPLEQRRAMEAMMKQAQQGAVKTQAPKVKPEDCVPDKVDIKSTGKRVTVAGYDAHGYQIFSNGKLDSEVYIAPAITVVREIDPQKLERMVTEMMKAFPQCPPRRGMIGADPVWKLMKDGYPVRSIEKDGASTTEVTKAENRSIGVAEFQPPAGFARKTLQEMMGGK
jgi:hypothetical protein